MDDSFWRNLPSAWDEDDDAQEDRERIAAGYAAADVARMETQRAAERFAKPQTYKGNRTLYDNGSAKAGVKKDAFQNNVTVTDPYTGQPLVLTKQEAKMRYGDKWQEHLAEADHVKPLEKIHEDTKNNVWNTTGDVKDAANSDDNLRVTSRKYNNAKRSRTNREYVEDDAYLEDKGVQLTEGGKEAAIRDGELAEKAINRQLNKAAAKNILTTGHNAGVHGAQSAGITTATMAGITNMVAVAKGEKDFSDAIVDTARVSGQAAVTGYVTSGGLTVIAHSLSNAKSQFIQGLVKSNIPGQVITAVMVMGDTLKRYANGEISTQECLIGLGERGLNFATVGYSMAMGQALIPIPIVGGAIGALVGATLTSDYYHGLIQTLQTRQLEHQERQRIIEECAIAKERAQAYRMELEQYLQSYFAEYRTCFNEALSSIRSAFQANNADGVIAGANQITRKLGGQVRYNTVEEFRDYFNSTSVDIL